MPTSCRVHRQSAKFSRATFCRPRKSARTSWSTSRRTDLYPGRGGRRRPGSPPTGRKQSTMDLGLKGRVAVITGPAKGMGAAVSKAFASEGCKVALIGRDTKAIEPVADEIRKGGGEAIIVPCDVTNAAACESAAKATRD